MIQPNPYREARIHRGLSQEKLAEQSNVSRLSILRLEQGLFAEPLGKVSLALGLDHGWAREQYRLFQQYHRQSKDLPPVVGTDLFLTWRIRNWESQASFCVDFCVSQSTLHRYELNSRARMPGQLREALLDAGLTEREVNLLARTSIPSNNAA